MSQNTRNLLAVVAALAACPLLADAQPATRSSTTRPGAMIAPPVPGMVDEVDMPAAPIGPIESRQQLAGVLKLTLADPNDPPSESDLSSILSDLERRVDGNTLVSAVFVSSGDPEDLRRPAGITLGFDIRTSNRNFDESTKQQIVDFVARQLKALTRETAGMNAAERAAKLRGLNAQYDELNRQWAALNTLDSLKSNPQTRLTQKVQQLRQEGQRLEMERAAKDARRQALMKAVDRERERAGELRKTDDIARELQRLLEMRMQRLALVRQQVASGVTSSAESSEAEAAVSEARIRLAEREASLGKAGKGELLDRLTDELSMISVDVTDIDLQSAYVRNELAKYDTRSMDSAGLARVMQAEPELQDIERTSNVAALRGELRGKMDAIPPDRFALKVTDVDLVLGDAGSLLRGGRRGGIAPSGGRGGAGGGGGGRRGPATP